MSSVEGFEASIRPLFRETDRGSMMSAFDLWDYDDVVANAPAILNRLERGDMPCDAPWPPEQVATFAAWVQADTPR